MVDLHLHSTCSDGSLKPAELVARAKLRGLTAIALTDHDTLDGNREAMDAGEKMGIKVFAGVEFSVEANGAEIHVLGYGVENPGDKADLTLKRLKEIRERRLMRMVARLNDMGINISSAEVRGESGGGVIGRLHVARALIKRRVVGSVREAFSEYLGRGGKAYVERDKLTPGEAIDLIHSLGAVAVLAHPGMLERDSPGNFEEVVDMLANLGLDGIEAHYSSHSAEQTALYASLARARGLIVTGGSDFHRPDNDGPEMGTGTGRLRVPPETVPALEKAIAGRRKA